MGREKWGVILFLTCVLAVRLVFLAVFHHQRFSGPSAQFDLAFVAMNILDGNGIQTFKHHPRVVHPRRSSHLLDPENYVLRSRETVPYVREVPGYAYFLAFLWKLFGKKLFVYVQVAQILLDVLASWLMFVLVRKYLDRKAAFFALFIFAFLFFEARLSVVPYKDIFLLYFMAAIALFSGKVFFERRKTFFWFFMVSLLSGLGFYFMSSIALYPLFLAVFLFACRRINLKSYIALFLMGSVVISLAAAPQIVRVHKYKDDPRIARPLFWYDLWIGSQVEVFYSTREERLERYFKKKAKYEGMSIEEISKEEFLDYIKAEPVRYALKTAKKLLYGTILVYANAGDASYPASFNHFKKLNPGAGYMDYARAYPLLMVGRILGTLSASLLFPLSLAAAVILFRKKQGGKALFFLHIPVYFILFHLFFHYEARYLVGALPGYLALVGFLLSRIFQPRKASAA